MPDLPPVTNPPFGITKQSIERVNSAMETPLVRLFAKGFWFLMLGLGAIGLYAGKQKLQEVIATNTAVVEARTTAETAATKAQAVQAALDVHTTAIAALHADNDKLAGAIDKFAGTLQILDAHVVAVATRQEDARKEQQATTERQDATLNILLQKK